MVLPYVYICTYIYIYTYNAMSKLTCPCHAQIHTHRAHICGPRHAFKDIIHIHTFARMRTCTHINLLVVRNMTGGCLVSARNTIVRNNARLKSLWQISVDIPSGMEDLLNLRIQDCVWFRFWFRDDGTLCIGSRLCVLEAFAAERLQVPLSQLAIWEFP